MEHETAGPRQTSRTTTASAVSELARLRAENDKLREWVKEVHGALSRAKKSPSGGPSSAAPEAGMERRLTRSNRVAPATAARPTPPPIDELERLGDAYERGVQAAQREFEALIRRCRDQHAVIETQASEIADLKARLRALRRAAQRGDVPAGPPVPSRHGPERPSQLVGSLRTLNKRVVPPTQ